MDTNTLIVFSDDGLTMTATRRLVNGADKIITLVWKDADQVPSYEELVNITNNMFEKSDRDLKIKPVEGVNKKGAKSWVKKINLPFGYAFKIGRFTGHEYDTAAVLFGKLKFAVPVREGKLNLKEGYWKKQDSKMFGFGGTANAIFASLGKDK